MMPKIILTEKQAKTISEAREPIILTDAVGNRADQTRNTHR
jgi:hypothetical protein